MNALKTVKTTLPLISLVSVLLAGCATSSKGPSVLPQDGPSMSEIYDHQNDWSTNAHSLDRVRGEVLETSNKALSHNQWSSLNNNEYPVSDAPHVLPNPLIAIYVYSHFDGDDQDYVPGHKAYTKLYKETHFALPGEATEME